jgi:alkanesulfonate monooxygenase SsuD/methylene tetrahydromethanopterin reductase-like flavin-dependent oxidoreductase (luciferase family)
MTQAGEQPFAFSIMSDVRPDPAQPDAQRRYEELLEEVSLAEQLGFKAFSTSEQHAVDDAYLGAQLPLLAGVATRTSKIRLGPACILLPLYNWRQVIEGAVVLDLLSEGRLELGLSLGAFRREFDVFGVNFDRRGAIMEEGMRFVRQGLTEYQLPDGPEKALLPVSPHAVQDPIPIFGGGTARPAVDRAVRLADGYLGFDYEHFEVRVPDHWNRILHPTLQKHSRSLDEFYFKSGTVLWCSEDPERDWETFVGPSFEYLQRRYFDWSGSDTPPDGLARDISREKILVDTPSEVARRLVETHKQVPWHELVFWYRLPGVPHQKALEHLDLVANTVTKLVVQYARGGSNQ